MTKNGYTFQKIKLFNWQRQKLQPTQFSFIHTSPQYSLDMTILIQKEVKQALIFYYWFFQVDQGITFYMQGLAMWWSKIRQIVYCVPMKVFHQKVFIWCICTQNIILKLMPCFVFLAEFQHQFSNTSHVIKSNVFR